jgi:hypothetical protein
MKHNKVKVPENLVLVPQLDDISNIHTRLIQLSGKLKSLPTYDLYPDDRSAIGRAMGLIDGALMLEAINFDLMKAVVDELDDATVEPCHSEVRDLYSLAVDIWIDIPIDMMPSETNDSDCTAPDCDCITWGCCGKELESENLALEQKPFAEGQRVRLTRTLLDETTDAHPVHLYEGDLGTVEKILNGELGFKSDRWGNIITISRIIDAKFVKVLNYCEPIYQCPSRCRECEAPEQAIYKMKDSFSLTGYFWQCAVCNSILSPAPAPKTSDNGGAK